MPFVPMKYEKDVKLAIPSTRGEEQPYGIVFGGIPGRLIIYSMMWIYGIGYFMAGRIPIVLLPLSMGGLEELS